MVRLSRALPLLALLAACAPAAPATLSDADRAAIQTLSDSFAARIVAGNADAAAMLYTDNAALMPPDAPPVRGHDAIKAFIAGFPRVKTFMATNDTIVGMGDRAYVRGHFALTFADSMMGGASGKFVEVRHKQADGTWPYEIDMWSMNAPPPAPMPAPAPAHSRR